MTKITECNFATTYFMEVWKGSDGQVMKVYESDLWVDESTRDICLEFDDGTLCNGDHDMPLTFKFISRNQYKMENTEVASCSTCLSGLKGFVGSGPAIIDACGARKGTLCVKKCDCAPIKSFADCIKEGVEISIIGAIDFTYSNGDASNPSSLHYICDGKQTQYECALDAVGSCMSQYDSDQLYPVFGFGAIPPGESKTSHCFSIAPGQEQIHGMDNVLAAYRSIASQVQMSGPTNFAPVFRKAIEMVERAAKAKQYYILFILTDGEIHDMKETV